MSVQSAQRPKLRPVEAFPCGPDVPGRYYVRDPTGWAKATLTVSDAALYILSLLDGTRDLSEIRREFAARFGQPVAESTLAGMIEHLHDARLLEGEAFEAFLEEQLAAYRSRPARPSVCADLVGSGGAAAKYMADLLGVGVGRESVVAESSGGRESGNGRATRQGRLRGLVAPHLDYPRGRPCYRAAYGLLAGRHAPAQCVILGTNHFGRACSVVATGKAFETPLGVTEVAVDFLAELERRCGFDLCAAELDHAREHSIELQVMCLQHVFGPDAFRMVPVLCPDPCGPTGTQPVDGVGPDLAEFADQLGRIIRDDPLDTLLIAGADLSHVGTQFGDPFDLDDGYLKSVERQDRAAIEQVLDGSPDGFLRTIAAEENPTHVCSAGCLYVLARALTGVKPTLLCYHQAFTPEAQTCVTCAALSFVG